MNKSFFTLRTILSMLCAVALSACGASDSDASSESSCDGWVKVTGVDIVPEQITAEVGEVFSVEFNVVPACASQPNVTFQSTDGRVVSTTGSGTMTARQAGTATLTVVTKDGGFTDTVEVSVVDEVTPTPPVSGNLLENGDFETGSLTPWLTQNASTSISTVNVHGGSYAMHVNGGSSAYQEISVEPNTTYTLTGWARVGSDDQTVYLGVKNYGGDDTSHRFSSSTYQKATISFTTGSSNTSARIYVWNGDAGHQAWADDLAVSSGSLLTLEQEALEKISVLEVLISQANQHQLDTAREETTLWFAREFLKYANWDKDNLPEVEKFFEHFYPYRNEASEYAAILPDFERQQVINILDKSIATLSGVLDGSIVRRPAGLLDWKNIGVQNDMFTSNGKPAFLYDYFSKSMGNPTSDSDLYNDHLGNLDVLPGINPHWVNSNSTLQNWRVTQLAGYPSTKTGYSLLWNSGIPNWMTQQEPEITVGRSLFTGYDIDNPLMKRSWSTILRGVAPVIGGHKAIDMGVILSNEPHWFSEQGHWTQNYGEMNAISSYTLEKFKQWLNDKYSGSIASLNKNWSTQFSNFDAIQFSIPIDPATRGTPVWYDWCRFNMDRVVSWFSFLQGELHAVDSSIDTSIKIMPDLFTENNRSHGIDLEALTNLTTMIGDDAKTRKRDLRSTEPEHWEEHYAYFWEELAVSYDFMESVSPGKIHVNSEAHFLSSSWWRELSVSPAYVRNTYWLATILGMDASMSWFWARDPDGSPEQRLEGDLEFFDPAMAGAFAASANMQPQVANELAQTMFDLNAYSEEVMALRKQRRPVRLFYSETSAINKTAHMTDQFEIYESLFFEGFPVGYATQNIIENQDHSNWDVVVVYKTPFATDAEFAALQAYLNAGGTVILDSTASLSKNEYGQNRASSLVAGQGTLHVMGVSAQVGEIKQQVLSSLTNSASGVVLTESNGLTHKGCVWRVVPKAEGGYLMTVINLGKNTAQLQVSMTDETQLKAVDLLTGTQLGSEFELVSEGVLLLELVSL